MHLKIVLRLLQENRLFVGHVVSNIESLVDSSKIEAVMNKRQPKKKKNLFEILNFLCLSWYYFRFMENFSRLLTTTAS